jgi:hypothetical protein
MNEMEHSLIVDYRFRSIEARCSCGEWAHAWTSIRGQELRDVYDRIEEAHCRHVEEAERVELSPA